MREPPELRHSCAAKLAGIETSPQFRALLACLLDEDWTTPRIEELYISPDRGVLARPTGEVSFKVFLGAEQDLVERQNLAEAVRFASAAGALSVTCRGAQSSLPIRPAIERLLAGQF